MTKSANKQTPDEQTPEQAQTLEPETAPEPEIVIEPMPEPEPYSPPLIPRNVLDGVFQKTRDGEGYVFPLQPDNPLVSLHHQMRELVNKGKQLDLDHEQIDIALKQTALDLQACKNKQTREMENQFDTSEIPNSQMSKVLVSTKTNNPEAIIFFTSIKPNIVRNYQATARSLADEVRGIDDISQSPYKPQRPQTRNPNIPESFTKKLSIDANSPDGEMLKSLLDKMSQNGTANDLTDEESSELDGLV